MLKSQSTNNDDLSISIEIKTEFYFLICYLGFQHLIVKLFHAGANYFFFQKRVLVCKQGVFERNLKTNRENVYCTERKRETWTVCLYTNRKIRVKHEYEQYWVLSIGHGTHCVFLDDYWASRSRFLLIFMKLSYVSICQHRAAIKKYYIIVHFNERKRFRVFLLFVELLCAYLATKTVGSPKQSSFCKWAAILHTCYVCFVVLLKIVLCIAIDVGGTHRCVVTRFMMTVNMFDQANRGMFDLMEWLTYLFFILNSPDDQ